MEFIKESDFENALTTLLFDKGWDNDVIYNPSEDDLIQNWADILFNSNKDRNKLNGEPLTKSEMAQIIEKINALRTPLALNSFINGKTVSIKRDNQNDTLNFGKEVSLKIYDRNEIAEGQSRYQILRQAQFKRSSPIAHDRRGDITLLINGMPLFHIELKRSGTPLSQAYNQIEKYTKEGIFSGIFSLIQIFVAMTPEECVYFANAGKDGRFNKDYFFSWGDFDNEPKNHWKDIASLLLSIPMAHQLIGFYTVADNSDGVLKVMRSYQYNAARIISEKVSKLNWKEKHNQRGGYIWHTTGSGKTLTSFKSAQLIANLDNADKVIFLVDRIELGTQSLKEYRNFANDNEDVQATENTHILTTKLKSSSMADRLIVTSIQKLSNITKEEAFNAKDIEVINNKRIVIIVDECHRSTFGDMLVDIKNTFAQALFFGFTGTPIQEENAKGENTTSTVFGDELHRYSIADGIRDKNVLGFDVYKVLTYKDKDIRQVIALEKAKASSIEEALSNKEKSEIYYHYMNDVPMLDIEKHLSPAQYKTLGHKECVIQDIKENWLQLSHNNKFHAILATASINEAIEYYRLFKQKFPTLKTTCLFDPNIDNNDNHQYKEEGLIEIISDYNKRYNRKFTLAEHSIFKKDIAMRLAHKEIYRAIENKKEEELDLLIVVNQMLTGYDSKWINTLYLDKELKHENIIQAFSRTNRLFGAQKPFGTIRYYRYPHTMESNINTAVKQYSGDKPIDLFVDKLEANLKHINNLFEEIKDLFKSANIDNFEKLPSDESECAKFASLLKELNDKLENAKIQGFKWSQKEYTGKSENGDTLFSIQLNINESQFNALIQRYKELAKQRPSSGGSNPKGDVPYDIDNYITEIDTGRIDSDYMNNRFKKYIKEKEANTSLELIEKTLNELHKSFATLSQEEQKYANILLGEIQRNEIVLDENKSLRDYITEYIFNAKNDQIHKFADTFGIDEEMLRNLMGLKLTEQNINEFARFDNLKKSADLTKAKAYFEHIENKKFPTFQINIKLDSTLREFILKGGFDL